MKELIIHEAFWQLFPEGRINVLVVKNINNQQTIDSQPLLDQASTNALSFTQEESWTDNPVISQWRQAYQQFKTKKGARSSIEALLKRNKQGHPVKSINPLVDLYNVISLTYGVPCGGEDLAKIDGNLNLGLAKGGESFLPLGAEEDSPALTGELCYFDNTGAVCRCLNWREAQRTMLTDTTQAAILLIEAINNEQAQRANEAILHLQELVAATLGVKGEIYHLTPTNTTITL